MHFIWFVPGLALLASPPGCHCTIFQIDDAYPFLSIGGTPIQWHSGAAAQWALSSLLVRIHPRGVGFKNQNWHLRDFSHLGWTAESCIPSAHGLCQTTRSVFFPSSQLPEINEAASGACSSAKTGRVITNASRYDFSSCDVLDQRMDFVYSKEVMRYSKTSLPVWTYWTLCVLVVFLVRCLSRYIMASLVSSHPSTEQPPDPWVSLTASAASVILVVSGGDAMYITYEDLIFYWFTVFYVCTYACIFAGVRMYKSLSQSTVHDPPFYNLLAGVLQLVSTRLYAGAETPYNPPLIFIIAVRTLAKSRRRTHFIRGVTLLLDACMLALMCIIGFGPSHFYLVALFSAAGTWVDYLD